MTRICTGSGISLLLLLLPFVCTGQNSSFDTLGFYNHLVTNNLLREQLAFNKQWIELHSGNATVEDSVLLNNAIIYYKLNVDDSSVNNLAKIPLTAHFTGHSERLYISMLLLQKKIGKADTELNRNKPILKSGTYFNDARLSLAMLKHEKIITDTSQTEVSGRIKEIRSNYEKMPHHSGVVAGFSSALVPGLGKWYLGYKHQAVSAFIFNVFLAAQSVESYERAGPSSIRFIVSASLFGLFYGGNILGSIIAAHKQKHDYLKQMDYEILDFHNAVVGKSGL